MGSTKVGNWVVSLVCDWVEQRDARMVARMGLSMVDWKVDRWVASSAVSTVSSWVGMSVVSMVDASVVEMDVSRAARMVSMLADS